MKIGIDIQAAAGPQTGLGVYTNGLLDSLLRENGKRHTFHLYRKEGEQRSRDLNTLERLVWENMELPRQVKRDRVELLHVPAFAPPLIRPCRVVATVHDLIELIFPNAMGWPSRFYWSQWLPRAVRGADRIIADSQSTKADIEKYLGIDEKRIAVIYPSGHEGFTSDVSQESLWETRRQFGIREKYFLSVGTLEPRKNIFRVIEAFQKFLERKKESPVYQLVLVGSLDFGHGRFFERLRRQCPAVWDSLVFTGYVPKENLNLLYTGAEVFVYPSLYEGFGIPVLEAMASGVPVLTSRFSSLPEVAGDAAFYVDPMDSNAIAEGLFALTEDERLRKELVQKGLERRKRFSWRETAREILRVYEFVS